MIMKVLELIIGLLMFVLKLILKIILLLFPALNMSGFDVGINAFLGMMNNAVNMTAFLVGPTYVLFFDVAVVIWATRHSILPVICFLRKCVIKN